MKTERIWSREYEATHDWIVRVPTKAIGAASTCAYILLLTTLFTRLPPSVKNPFLCFVQGFKSWSETEIADAT